VFDNVASVASARELLFQKYNLFSLYRMVSIQRFDRLCQFFEKRLTSSLSYRES